MHITHHYHTADPAQRLARQTALHRRCLLLLDAGRRNAPARPAPGSG